MLFLSKRTHPSTFPISPEKSPHAGVFTMAVGAHGGQLSTHIVWTFRQKKRLGMRRDVLISQRHVCVCIGYAHTLTVYTKRSLHRSSNSSPPRQKKEDTQNVGCPSVRPSVRPSFARRGGENAHSNFETLVAQKKDKRDTANVTRLT